MIAGNYVDEVMNDSPYQWLRFNETSGSTVLDSSGNNRNGSLIGSVDSVVGPVDRAVSLSGSSQAVNANNTAFGSQIGSATFELLIDQ